MVNEGKCKRKKHGAEYRRQWRKVYLAIDARTLEVRAIAVGDGQQCGRCADAAGIDSQRGGDSQRLWRWRV